MPVHLGGAIVGLLDLHAHRPAHYPREALVGLQLLANQLGVGLRNAELYSEAVAARRLAEQADQLKTALLANVSHELRTPLSVILGYSRMALDSLEAPARAGGLAHDLAQIQRSGEHLLRLINDLLDLSRAEIGELAMELEPVELGRFIEEVFRSSADNFAAEGGVWHLALPPDLPPVEADPVRLRQVLFNLLHNTAKFTGRGSVTLGAEADGADLRIWVADTGPGIPQERQEQIFRPFVSTDAGPHGGGGSAWPGDRPAPGAAAPRPARPALLAWDLTQATPDSLALLERLRAHPQLSQIPLVVHGAETETDAPADVLTGVRAQAPARQRAAGDAPAARPRRPRGLHPDRRG